MKKIILLLTLITLFVNKVKADDNSLFNETYSLKDLDIVIIQDPIRTPGEFGEKQTWINQNAVAPFAGILLNPEAMAYIISDKEAYKLRFNETLNKQRELDLAKLNLETGNLKLKIENIQKINLIELNGRDEEIKRLQKINNEIRKDRNDFKRKLFIGLGSGSGGVIMGFLLGLFLI